MEVMRDVEPMDTEVAFENTGLDPQQFAPLKKPSPNDSYGFWFGSFYLLTTATALTLLVWTSFLASNALYVGSANSNLPVQRSIYKTVTISSGGPGDAELVKIRLREFTAAANWPLRNNVFRLVSTGLMILSAASQMFSAAAWMDRKGAVILSYTLVHIVVEGLGIAALALDFQVYFSIMRDECDSGICITNIPSFVGASALSCACSSYVGALLALNLIAIFVLLHTVVVIQYLRWVLLGRH